MNNNKTYRFFLGAVLFLVLSAALTSCPKPPLNPWDDEGVSLGLVTAAPVIETEGGTYNKDISIVLSCGDPDAVVYYTTDGSDPDESSAECSGEVCISGDGTATVVKAVAINPAKAASHVIAASYNIEYLELRVAAGDNGSTAPSAAVKIAQDSSVVVSASADSTYAFSHWSVESGIGVMIDDIYSESTEVTLTESGGEVKANFAPGISLTLSSDGNGSTVPAGAVLVASGIPRTVRASADTGWDFDLWTIVSGSGVSIDDQFSDNTTVTLTEAAVVIRADFVRENYNLNVLAGENGSVSPSGMNIVEYGIPQSVDATADAGFQFAGWSLISGTAVFDDQNSASTAVTLYSGDASIQAEFISLPADLTVTNDGHGTTLPSGRVTIPQDVPFNISSMADQGYIFSKWSITGGSGVVFDDDFSASTTVMLTDGDAEILANTVVAYTLSVTSNGNGTTLPDGDLLVAIGAENSILASPSPEYTFSHWSVNNGTADIDDIYSASTNVILNTEDASIQANFIDITLLKTIGVYSTADSVAFAVSIAGNTIVLGNPQDDFVTDANEGSAAIYYKDNGGIQNWGLQKTIWQGNPPEDYGFGHSLCCSGDYIVVGTSDRVSVYIFYRDEGGIGNWGLQKELNSPNSYFLFGESVSLSGDTLLVSQKNMPVGVLSQVGEAYLYKKDFGGTNNWGLVKTLSASDGLENTNFGECVYLTGDYAFISALGNSSVYIFQRDFGGADNWGEMKKLTAYDGISSDSFGYSISGTGQFVLVGAPYDDDLSSDCGSAYLYSKDQGGLNNWGLVKK